MTASGPGRHAPPVLDFSYEDARFPVRRDLREAHKRADMDVSVKTSLATLDTPIEIGYRVTKLDAFGLRPLPASKPGA